MTKPVQEATRTVGDAEVDRVADAIENAWDEAGWDGTEGACGLPPIDFTPDEKRYLAHAAIVAMFTAKPDPEAVTPAMIDAAVDSWDSSSGDDRGRMWNAIEAALLTKATRS